MISQADDYGTQTSQLISPRMFRRIFKPRLQAVFARIHQLAPHAKLFFHSDGNIRADPPGPCRVGVDILNPVHITAAGMEPAALKRASARTVLLGRRRGNTDRAAIWHAAGGAGRGAPHIEALAPGGGFVFNTIHNIQADVPPQNSWR